MSHDSVCTIASGIMLALGIAGTWIAMASHLWMWLRIVIGLNGLMMAVGAFSLLVYPCGGKGQ